MAEKYGITTSRDLKRITAATRRVEGTPGTYVRVPDRVPRRGAGGGGGSVIQSNGGPFTILEYDAETGDPIQTLDRGRERSATPNVTDTDVLVVEDDDGTWLYAVGFGYINRSTGVIAKWNAETGEREWDSDAGAFSGPIFAQTNGGNTSNRLVVASDGFIWAIGTDTSDTCIGRFNATTGVQTHKIAIALSTSLFISMQALPVDGKVLVSFGSTLGGQYARIYDDTGTSVANLTAAPFRDYVINGSLIYATMTAGADRLKIYDFTLTEQDSRAAPGAEAYGAIATDGTTVWVTTSGGATPMIRAYDATNLATENWNAAQDAAMATVTRLIHANSALYTFAAAIRKHSVADGSETWQSAASGFRPTVNPGTRNYCQVGTDFVLVCAPSGNEQVYCLNDTDGTTRWFDEWTAGANGSLVTADDRVFVCGGRMGP
jgi:hypothetical protein